METQNCFLTPSRLQTRVYLIGFILYLCTVFITGLPKLCDIEKPSHAPTTCILMGSSVSSWSSAENFCQTFGGDLISVNNDTTSDELSYLLKRMNDHDSHGPWIGLNDLRNRGVFEWADGAAIDYTNWNSEIQNWNPENDTGSCVYLNSENTWNIADCSVERGFVCLEKSFVLDTESCGGGMIRFRNSCYWLLLDQQDWNMTENWCMKEGGHLVAINDELENMFLYNILMTHKRGYWIGLRSRNDATQKEWITNEQLNYSNWIGIPDNSLENCPIISREGKWIMQSCSSLHPGAICEKPLIVSPSEKIVLNGNFQQEQCPLGWEKLKNRCYKIEKEPLLSWDDAVNHCLGLGGQIASFETADDEKFIFQRASGAFNVNNIQDYWIGLKCSNKTFDVTWTDGTSLTYIKRNPAEEKEVRNANPDVQDFCIAHSLESKSWLCLPCNFEVGSVCSKILPQEMGWTVSTTVTNSEAIATDSPCLEGWTLFDKNCYVIVNTKMNWLSAREECKKSGPLSDLVSIHSPLQQEFISHLMKNNQVSQVWLGLNDIKTEGLFEWSDGSYLNYDLRITISFATVKQAWEDCVTMKLQNVWLTIECAPRLPFICQQVNEDNTPTPVLTVVAATRADLVDASTESDIAELTTSTSTLTTSNADDTFPDYETTAPTPNTDHAFAEYDSPDYSTMDELGDMTMTGMSGGTIAGIVLGCLILATLLVIGFIYSYQKSHVLQAVKSKISFENNLYNPYGDQIQLHPTVKEATT